MPNPFFSYWGKTHAQPGQAPQVHLLAYHCLDVAAVGRVILRQDRQMLSRLAQYARLPEDSFLALVSFWLATHDLGKFARHFQAKSPEAYRLLRGKEPPAKYEYRHTNGGYWLWRKKLAEDFTASGLFHGEEIDESNLEAWLDVLAPWERACLGHHGTPPACPDHRSSFMPEDIMAAREFVQAVANLVLSGSHRLPAGIIDDSQLEIAQRKVSWHVAGVAVLADWIGSSAEFFPLAHESMPLEEYLKLAEDRAAKAVERVRIIAPRPSTKKSFGALLPHLAGKTPSSLQAYAQERSHGSRSQTLFIFEDTTGSGKTEAALLAAHGLMSQGLAGGLFIALPTMATADAMFERMRDSYENLYEVGMPPSLTLAHGQDHLRSVGDDDGTSEALCSEWLADHRKASLLASVGVGTIDQALLGVLPSRHQSLRLLGLGRNVLIVDEVHAYDAYVNTLLGRLLEFHAAQGGSAILLSATLPHELREFLVEAYCKGARWDKPLIRPGGFPMATVLEAGRLDEQVFTIPPDRFRRLQVDFVHSETQVAAEALGIARAGGCALWVRNTVTDALAGYDLLRQEEGIAEVILFHARFTVSDRQRIEAEIVRRFGKTSTPEERAGWIVVATQVAEQSLDLDFDLVISDLAPMESMIQRAGRGCRHARSERRVQPRLVVHGPDPVDAPPDNWYAAHFRAAATVYPKQGPLWAAARWLKEHGEFTLPRDAREMIVAAYAGEGPDAFTITDLKAEGKELAAKAMGLRNALRPDEGYTVTDTHWLDDTVSPTRLGEPSLRLRFCRYDGSDLLPWVGDSSVGWASGDVSVRARQCAGVVCPDVPGLADALERAREAMPDKGRWCVPIAMLWDADTGTWLGRGIDDRRRNVVLRYTPERGLEMELSGRGK